MNINITCKRESIGLQLFDKWYAYRQSLDSKNYKSDIAITFHSSPVQGAINIWFEYMPTSIDQKMFDYDLIFLCNGGEPLTVSNHTIVELASLDQVYLVADGYVTEDHPMYNKIIWHPHDPLNCNDYWSRSFYPQLYNNHANTTRKKIGNIHAINGANRSHRNYFFSLLKDQVPEIQITGTYSSTLGQTQNAFWESNEDTVFRLFVNEQYQDKFNKPSKSSYYSSSIGIGVNEKFGTVPPGYFILNEYFDYQCMVFPETTWQNNELTLTEKGLKCFYSQCLPMPVGGSNVNRLYNSLGYYTAWNLLPSQLQVYDSNKNHQERCQQQIAALAWLSKNTDVFASPESIEMKRINRNNFLSNFVDVSAVKKFDRQFFEQIHV